MLMLHKDIAEERTEKTDRLYHNTVVEIEGESTAICR